MRSIAFALAWQLARRNRLGFIALACALVGLVLVVAWAPETFRAPKWGNLLGLSLLPIMVFLLTVFTYGMEADVASGRSGFPARMFTLPLRTRVLIAWPMLYGMVCVSVSWLVLAIGVFRPCAVDSRLASPALTFCALLCWLQALAWTPFAIPSIRTLLAAILLTTMLSVCLMCIVQNRDERAICASVAATIPLAYACALYGVSRARRGENPQWRHLRAAWTWCQDRLPSRRRDFASSLHAQVWFELRRCAATLPLFTAGVLVFAVSPMLLFRPEFLPLPLWWQWLQCLIVPIGLAGMLSPSLGRGGLLIRDPRLSSFLATRPISDLDLVIAKVKMAFWSSLASMLLALVAMLVCLLPVANRTVLFDIWDRWRQIEPGWRGAILFPLGLLAAFGLIWRSSVLGLCLGLTGRRWLNSLATWLGMVAIVALVSGSSWIRNPPTFFETARKWLPWVVGGLAILKLGCSARLLRISRLRGLIDARRISRLRRSWFVAVVLLGLAMYAGLSPWVPIYVPWYALVPMAILAMPTVSLLLAPLALAWNRHR